MRISDWSSDVCSSDLQPRGEAQEVPFRTGGIQYVVHRDAHLAEDHGDFVDEGDVDVALRVLDHLGGLGGADVLGDEDVAAVDRAVDGGQPRRDVRRLPRDDLGDAVDGVVAVAGVDSFRRVSEADVAAADARSEGHTSELQSLMRTPSA